jgi:TIR domain-containing protein
MTADKARIFISYREDTEHAVARLAEDLGQHFSPAQIFHDIASIAPGADFVEALQHGLDGCAAVLVVIGPRWLGASDAEGRRRPRGVQRRAYRDRGQQW